MHVLIRLHPDVSGSRVSGWRGLCRIANLADFGVEMELVGRSELHPGEQSECRLRMWAADFLSNPIKSGTPLLLLEGGRQVAGGEVISFTSADDA